MWLILRESSDIEKLGEELALKRHLEQEVERKRRELEGIEQHETLEEHARRRAENDRQKAEMQRQDAEKKRSDENQRRWTELDDYKKELEQDSLKRQQEADRYNT